MRRTRRTIAVANQEQTHMVSPAAFPLMTELQRSGDPCSSSVANAIENLRDTLHQTYGGDYAFTVLGKGHILGASTRQHGVIIARTDRVPRGSVERLVSVSKKGKL